MCNVCVTSNGKAQDQQKISRKLHANLHGTNPKEIAHTSQPNICTT